MEILSPKVKNFYLIKKLPAPQAPGVLLHESAKANSQGIYRER